MYLKTPELKGECCYYKNDFRRGRASLVFLHGLTGHSGVWKSYMNHFGKRYNILAIDLTGHGKSKRPYKFSGYSISSISDSVLKILKKENISSAHFVVHSYSFLIFLELVKKHKNVVKSSITISPYYPNHKTKEWKISRLISIFASALVFFLPTRKKHSLSDYSLEKENDADVQLIKVAASIIKTGIKSAIATGYYSLKYRNPQDWNGIKVPLLIITGKLDTVIHLEEVKNLASKITNSNLVVLEENNHLLVCPFHYKLIPIMEKFLEGKKLI